MTRQGRARPKEMVKSAEKVSVTLYVYPYWYQMVDLACSEYLDLARELCNSFGDFKAAFRKFLAGCACPACGRNANLQVGDFSLICGACRTKFNMREVLDHQRKLRQ